jgi:hypothetical protein
MPSFSAQNIIDRAAAASDMHDNFVDPNTWIAWLNVERQALDIFCARSGWVLSGLSAFDVPAASFVPYQLTSPVLAIVGVWEKDSSGRLRQLVHTNFIDMNRQVDGTGPVTGIATNWSMDNVLDDELINIHLFPRPTSGTYRIVFAAATPPITSTVDAVVLPLGIEEYLVLRMARRALIKEESDVTSISKQIVEEKDRIEEICWSRAIGEVPAVRNVDVVNRTWSGQVIWPSHNSWVWA